MTAAAHARARGRAPAEPRPPTNWTMVGVAIAVLTHFAGAVWLASNLTTRMAALERELPPGAIATLTERTVQIQRDVAELKNRP